MERSLDRTCVPVVTSSTEGSAERREPIAVVGMGCRFPGAPGVMAFRRLLWDGVDAIGECPSGRYDVDALYSSTPREPGRIVTREGGFVSGIDRFDPYFFGISPREVARMDPQQRLLLEVAWEALEDGGQLPETLDGSPTGVFVGMWANEFEDLVYRQPEQIDLFTTTGSGRYAASGRISFVLGLQGPSLTVDTACSSSLVAVHLACQSLWQGESVQALAGGVNLLLEPPISIGYSRSGMLSPDARCKAFDARANGYVRSDGAAMVFLKPLHQALEDGDPVYSVILGSAVGSDGREGGLLVAPSAVGQEVTLRSAYRVAGVSPGDVSYVEAHGTGTPVGDPVEAAALAAVLAEGRTPGTRARLGSVKTNIGHTEAASGVAGLIKVALALEGEFLPTNLHCETPNPAIAWDAIPLEVQRERSPWPRGAQPRIAGVNSFGVSGTNAHLIVAEAPARSRGEAGSAPDPHEQPWLLTLSAKTPEALRARVRSWTEWLPDGQDPSRAEAPALGDVCYTANARRTAFEHRFAATFTSRKELGEMLGAFGRGEPRPGLARGEVAGDRPRVVFVLPGQGSQWRGMGRELRRREPIFRTALEWLETALAAEVDWSLTEQLELEEAEEGCRWHEIDVMQPMLFALEVALAELWRSWGIRPDVVIGQSMGEVAAAYIAGALSLEDAVRVICRRSRLLRQASGKGAMAVLEVPYGEAERLLAGREDRASIAVSASPSSTVLSGDPEILAEIVATLEDDGVFARMVKVDVASHSPQMDALREPLLEALAGISPRAGSIPMVSTVTGALSEGGEFDAAYWVRNLREPVLLSTGLEALIQEGHDLFLEISPHPVLANAVRDTLQYFASEGDQPGGDVLASGHRERGERWAMLNSLGTLFTRGAVIDWDGVYPSPGEVVRLPSYPWQRKRFWIDGEGTHRRSMEGAHPFLGLRCDLADGGHVWSREFYGTDPECRGHRVDGDLVVAGMVFAEMALVAASELSGGASHSLVDFDLHRPLRLPEDGGVEVQLALSGAGPEKDVRIYGRAQVDEPWDLVASGRLAPRLTTDTELEASATSITGLDPVQRQALRQRLNEEVSGAEFYRRHAVLGNRWDDAFQGIEGLVRRPGEALADLRLGGQNSDEDSSKPQKARRIHAGRIHAALLDAGLQALAAAAALDDTRRGGLFMLAGVDRLEIYAQPTGRLYAHARTEGAASDGILRGEVKISDEAGALLAWLRGVRFQSLSVHGRRSAGPGEWLYTPRWVERSLADDAGEVVEDSAEASDEDGTWIVFSDDAMGPHLVEELGRGNSRALLIRSGEGWEDVSADENVDEFVIDPAQPEDFHRLLAKVMEPAFPPCRGVLHLWSLNAGPGGEKGAEDLGAKDLGAKDLGAKDLGAKDLGAKDLGADALDKVQDLVAVSALHLVQALSRVGLEPRLYLVTRGAHAVVEEDRQLDPFASMLWSLGRVMVYEHPEFRCRRVDLEPCTDSMNSVDSEASAAALLREVRRGDGSDEVALRGGARWSLELAPGGDFPRARRPVASPYRLTVPEPGSFDALVVERMERRAPGPGEVEIEVRAAGLNFRDVMKSLGVYPGDEALHLGDECAGMVTATGGEDPDSRGSGFKVGDRVLAVAGHSLGTHVIADARQVVAMPPDWSFATAAAVPVAYITAVYALRHLARLRRGERILIHAATGGVGLAAVSVAQTVGAEIYATAGSEAKRRHLGQLGIEHVFDSRSLDFAEEVHRRTGGEGVDVVLNSLAGEALLRSLDLLAPYGRFLELGKRDIYGGSKVGLGAFKHNVTFFAVDLGASFHDRPELIGELLREAVDDLAAGRLALPEPRTFPLAEAPAAFRHMARAEHMGKIAFEVASSAVVSLAVRPLFTDGAYLITGGLGGLGLKLAGWMAERGARHLTLLGRSAPDAHAQAEIERLSGLGVSVDIAEADVTSEEQLSEVLQTIDDRGTPLRGVFHAAGLLDDGILVQLNRRRFLAVTAPKVLGAWNLHRLTRHRELEIFAMYSSIASLLGLPGQGNYAAANGFLDGLARARARRGLPGLSIHWGPFGEVGLAARPDRGDQLEARGIESLSPQEGLETLGWLLEREVAEVGVVPISWDVWSKAYPALRGSSYFSRVAPDPEKGAENLGVAASTRVLAASAAERPQRLKVYLCECLVQVMGFAAERIDTDLPLVRLGLDSLVAIELRNRFEADLGIRVPVVRLLDPQEGKIERLVAEFGRQLAEDDVLTEVNELSDEEVERMLAELERQGVEA